MPQDNLRSGVYRSFVTCNDPKGVVNCGIRKHKTSKKLEEKLEHPKMMKKVSKSTLRNEEKKDVVSKGGMEESHRASSFQLMEVSRGAQKLNQVIDSWSRRASFDGGSKDYAKDLLMGALDLQDSLVMLSELQEASQYRTKLKKKEKEKPCVSRADEVGIERTSSDRFGNPKYQNPRRSADGSSRDCYDELRDVIRDSLARQNLLPPQSSRENARQNLLTPQSSRESAYFDGRKMYSYADMPSTSSSSISSMTYSRDFASSESTSSSKILEGKPRTLNLVAKLMGLEDISSKPLQPASQKLLQRESVLIQTPVFDIDKQKGRKPQFVGQNMDRACMTLEEIIENMQYKGLLKNNQHQAYHPNTSYTERRLSYDASPIVLMKPTCPGVEAKKQFPHKFIPDEAALNYERKQRFSKTKEEITSKIMEYPRGPLISYESRRKLHPEEPPMHKLFPGKEAKTSRKVLAKPRDVEVITEKKLSSNKMKASVTISSIPQKEIVEKKIDKIRKATSTKKPVENESVKSKSVPRSPEQDKVPTTKLRKSETGSNIMNKNCISQRKSTGLNFSIKHTKSASSYGESEQKRNVKSSKPVKEPLTANPSIIVSSIECNDDDKLADVKKKSNTTIMDIIESAQLVTEEEMNVSGILIKEICDNSCTALCEDTLSPSPQENNTKCSNEMTNPIQLDLKECIICQTKTTADVTHSRTPESLQQGEEPSDNSNAYQPIVLQASTGLHDSAIVDYKLLLDCTNELLESRSKRHKLLTNPLFYVPIDDSGVCTSKDNLMEEARKGIENLRSYSDPGVNSVPAAETVYSVLERDLRCKGLGVGAWDLGWNEGFTGGDEVEQIVSDIEKLITSELIEEVLADYSIFSNSSSYFVL